MCCTFGVFTFGATVLILDGDCFGTVPSSNMMLWLMGSFDARDDEAIRALKPLKRIFALSVSFSRMAPSRSFSHEFRSDSIESSILFYQN